MTEEIPKWPDELPAPIEFGKEQKLICLLPSELDTDEKIINFVQEIYWYPDELYYFFTEVDEGFGEFLSTRFEKFGLIYTKNERCFYKHPKPFYENDFTQILPSEDLYDWQRAAATGQEYRRWTIALAPWRIKELDIYLCTGQNLKQSLKSNLIIF